MLKYIVLLFNLLKKSLGLASFEFNLFKYLNLSLVSFYNVWNRQNESIRKYIYNYLFIKKCFLKIKIVIHAASFEVNVT